MQAAQLHDDEGQEADAEQAGIEKILQI